MDDKLIMDVAVLTYKVIFGRTSSYLGPLTFMDSRRDLQSSGTGRLVQPPVRRSVVGGQAFPVAGPQLWNTLP